MRVFVTKWFKRFMRKAPLSRNKLKAAVQEIESGLHDGDLGKGLIKKRIARDGKGKSGGFRTMIVYSKGQKSFFVYGFPKNEKDNLDDAELEQFKQLAETFLEFTDIQIAVAIENNELEEVSYHEEDE